MSDKIPTARQIAAGKAEAERMIEFARLHVNAALEAAAKNYRFNEINVSDSPDYLENKILNSYPENLIQ